MKKSAIFQNWVALLEPTSTITGTKKDDRLTATSEHQLVLGLGGNDTLTSGFDQTALVGGQHKDTLTTDFITTSEANRALAIQIGNAGRDTLAASTGVATENGGVDIFADGGGGDDRIEARAYAAGILFGPTLFSTNAFGGNGHDVINLVADLDGDIDTGAFDGTAINTAKGGRGDDQITAFAQTFFFGFSSEAINILDGGDGNDRLDATAVGHSNGGDLARNSLSGGKGKDVLLATAITQTNSSDGTAVNELSGGEGNDTLTANHVSGENLLTDITSRLDGGDGNDRLIADSLAIADPGGGLTRATHELLGAGGHDKLTLNVTAAASTFDVDNLLDGGAGNDSLQADMEATGSFTDAGSILQNRLEGGSGHDRLSARITADFSEVFEAPDIINELNGGAGNDRLEAQLDVSINSIQPELVDEFEIGRNRLDGGDGDDLLFGRITSSSDSPTTLLHGSSFLLGGEGKDELTVSGGDRNVLDGGADEDQLNGGDARDILIGGEHDDVLIGGADADLFVFGAASGRDRIHGFEIGVDSFELLDGITITSLTQRGDDTIVRLSHGGSVALVDTALDDIGLLFTPIASNTGSDLFA
jgi:Ca2+-binding RTX toxin-like protein